MIYLDEILQGVKTVGITGHIRPDGDCVGSTLGVYNYICDNMPQVDVDICLQPINDKFLFLRNSDKIKEKADGNKLYDLLKYIIYASFYVIVIKTGMDFYEYKRFPKLYESYSAPWYTEALLYIAASLFVIVVCFVLRVIIGRKMKKR